MDRPLKIAFVIPYFYPAWQYGGQPRAAFDLARGLVSRGHHVRVITTDSGGTERVGGESLSHVEGIEILYYKNLSNDLAYRKRVFLPRNLRSDIHRQLKDRDIVHIHELRSTLTVIASSAAKALKKPYVLSPHGGLQHLGRAAAKTVFDGLWGKRIVRDAAALIAISPIEEKDAQEFGVDQHRISTIPNPIDTRDYENLPPRRALRQPQILFLGRLHPIKGADILIEAFAIARSRSLDADLLIAGPDDSQEAALRELVKKRSLEADVRFSGYLDGKAKLQAFVDSVVAVVPSRSEVFALTAIESLLCGTPVILSSACGLHPAPDQGVTWFKTGDVAALADALLSQARTSADPDFVRFHFSLSEIAARVEALYSRLIFSP